MSREIVRDRYRESRDYKVAVFIAKLGDVIPCDLAARLAVEGIDVDALIRTHA